MPGVGEIFALSGPSIGTSITERVTNLENNETVYQFFQYVGTSTSGQVAIPTEATIFDVYGDSVLDAIVVEADTNNNPTPENSIDSSGNVVQVTSLDNDGNYVLDSTPDSNACIIFYIVIKDAFIQNVPLGYVISAEKSLLSIPYADFYVSDTPPDHKTGRVFYDNISKTLAFYTHIQDTIIQVGQESVVYVRNNSGATILNGTPVYISGAVGQFPTIAIASADDPDTCCLLGLATHDIDNNTNGFVTISGEVRDLDTSAFTDGDEVYLGVSPALLTDTYPGFPNYAVRVGHVEYAHPVNGKIVVRPGVRLSNHVVVNNLTVLTSLRSALANIGDIEAGDYLEIESTGFHEAHGDGRYWVDIDFPIIIRTTGPGIPTLTTVNGNLQMPQWAVNDTNMCESQEFIHGWDEGSTCYWHLHLTTNGLDATDRYVNFQLEYAYMDADNAWVFPSAITTGDMLIPANTPDKTQIIISLANFTPTEGTIGDHCLARLTRVASTGTAPTNNPWIPMLQMHIQCNTSGSRLIATK